jgi:hypothetical protein
MIKRTLLLLSALALVFTTAQGCFLKKNRCDTCPSFSKNKRGR